jgi:transposase-like protein
MPWQLLHRSEVDKLCNVWAARSHDIFVKKVVEDWLSMMMDRIIQQDIASSFTNRIATARSPKDLWITARLGFDSDHRFWVGNRSMTIKQLIYRTNALQRLAKEIGEKIVVRPLYQEDRSIFFKIEFWPNL